MNCKQAKAIDLVSYLADLGHFPKRKSKDGYWYLSPLRNEKNPSFKVHLTKNIYYDHGGDEDDGGGTIIDFGVAYHKCTIEELLSKLSRFVLQNPQAFDRSFVATQKFDCVQKEKKIDVVSTGPIESPALIYYLKQRKIPFDLAERFFCEAKYTLYGKDYYAIGFKNDSGGWELRNPFFKGSCMPKGPTFINRGFEEVDVIEGGFSFLSLLVVYGDWESLESNFLILNSTNQFKKSLPILEKHKRIKLHLDNDHAGIKLTLKALALGPQYLTASNNFFGFKDWNKYLVDYYSLQEQPQKIIRLSRMLILPQEEIERLENLPVKEKNTLALNAIKKAA